MEPNPKMVYGGAIPKMEGLSMCRDGRCSPSECRLTNTNLVWIPGVVAGVVLFGTHPQSVRTGVIDVMIRLRHDIVYRRLTSACFTSSLFETLQILFEFRKL